MADVHWERAGELLESWEGVLYSGDLSGLVVLFPAADQLRAEDQAAEFTAGLAACARGPVHAAESFRRGVANIPAALEEASRVLTIVKAIPDAEDRPYRADELLVELAILGQPGIRGGSPPCCPRSTPAPTCAGRWRCCSPATSTASAPRGSCGSTAAPCTTGWTASGTCPASTPARPAASSCSARPSPRRGWPGWNGTGTAPRTPRCPRR
ncbi:hypothetical protein LUX39_48650 [Actinomadura madurae]|nr:hypothetical protein [Actinomadura madurae]MCQ0020560.1 hypothetical protein [Actinomadura madurae]